MPLVFGTSEEISASLQTAMDSIVGTNKMMRVDRQHHEDAENYKFPSCFINDVRRELQRVVLNVYKVSQTFEVIVFGRSEEGDLGTLLNALITDSCTALIADPTRGGKAYNTKIIQVETDEGYFEPMYVAAITVEVLYLARH